MTVGRVWSWGNWTFCRVWGRLQSYQRGEDRKDGKVGCGAFAGLAAQKSLLRTHKASPALSPSWRNHAPTDAYSLSRSLLVGIKQEWEKHENQTKCSTFSFMASTEFPQLASVCSESNSIYSCALVTNIAKGKCSTFLWIWGNIHTKFPEIWLKLLCVFCFLRVGQFHEKQV